MRDLAAGDAPDAGRDHVVERHGVGLPAALPDEGADDRHGRRAPEPDAVRPRRVEVGRAVERVDELVGLELVVVVGEALLEVGPEAAGADLVEVRVAHVLVERRGAEVDREHLGRRPAPAARHAPGVAVPVGWRQRQRLARGRVDEERLSGGIAGGRREGLPGEARPRAPLDAGVDVGQAERGHVVRPGVVVGVEPADVEGERPAERPLEARLDREPDPVRGVRRALAGLEPVGRLVVEESAPRVDALERHVGHEIGAEALAGPEDAGDAQGRFEARPLLVGEPQVQRLGGDVGVVGRVHRPEHQARAEAPRARRALLRDPELPLQGLLEDVPVLAVGGPEAETAVKVPGGRRVGERGGGGARRARARRGGGWWRRHGRRGLGGGGRRQARGDRKGAKRPNLVRHLRFSPRGG